MTITLTELFELERDARIDAAFRGPVSDLLCVLCHTRAWGWTAAIPDRRYERHPACQWCAGTLYGFAFHNVHEARQHLLAELYRMHGKDMAVPLFTQAELEQTGWALRTTFEASNARRRFLLDLRHGLGRLRAPVPLPVRAAVLMRDQGRCVACGSMSDLQVDHIVPASIGGPPTYENLRLLCRVTNARRQAAHVSATPLCPSIAVEAA